MRLNLPKEEKDYKTLTYLSIHTLAVSVLRHANCLEHIELTPPGKNLNTLINNYQFIQVHTINITD